MTQNEKMEYKKILSKFRIITSLIIIIISITTTSIHAYFENQSEKEYKKFYESKNNTSSKIDSYNDIDKVNESAIENNNNFNESTTQKNTNWDFTDFNPIPFSIDDFATIKKDPNWYDNGIFSSYMKGKYPNDTWEYQGTIICNMTINPYDYSGFQVYTHSCEEAQRVYEYLVPVSPANPPEVYVLDETIEGINMKLVFSKGAFLG